jgi:hypothetical protein
MSAVEFPRLSIQERDRRWAAVRARMRRRGVECVIVRADSSKWDAGSAEGRYLTHIGGNGEDGYVVFDADADPVFVIWGPDHVGNWREIQDWCPDIRPFTPSFAKTTAQRVRELGRGRSTLGLIGRLGSRLWRGEGRWPQGNYEALRTELPEATFVDFDEELWEERSRAPRRSARSRRRWPSPSKPWTSWSATRGRASASGRSSAGCWARW